MLGYFCSFSCLLNIKKNICKKNMFKWNNSLFSQCKAGCCRLLPSSYPPFTHHPSTSLSDSLLIVPKLVSSSGLSDASGLSDGNDGGSTSRGCHEGRSMKRYQRRSVRSRSRHEKAGKAKLNVLNVGSFPAFFSHLFLLTCFSVTKPFHLKSFADF